MKSVVAWIGAEMEFTLSQAVASGDAFEHRPSECGHCVQNFLADLDFRDLPGEAAGFELGADDTLPTADLRFYPAALVVPCGLCLLFIHPRRPEPDRSPICRDYACMISSFVRARPWARPQTQTLSC